ncbi:MAG: DNA-binding response regulator [Pleomorphochaeta sp.]
MNYSLIIVIKDNHTRLDLMTSIDWKQLGIELIASLSEGIIAQKVIEILKPDIVITEFSVRGIYSMLQSCPIYHTIIFGNSEKEMNSTHKAFGLGVFQYHQKPIIYQKINYLLFDMKKRIAKDKQNLIESECSTKNTVIQLKTSTDNQLTNSAINFIEQNYSKNIGLQETAAFLGVSEAHLSRVFKNDTKINFVKYLNSFRINESIHLMHDSSLSINQICNAVGIHNPSYYSKIFKNLLKVTPNKYRDSYINYNKK